MDKPKWLENLRLISRLTSVVMVILYSYIFFIYILFYNQIQIFDFILFLFVGSIYIIGALVSFFRERLSGLIILGFWIFMLPAHVLHVTLSINYLFSSLFFSIPGVLNILSWYYHKEFNKNLS